MLKTPQQNVYKTAYQREAFKMAIEQFEIASLYEEQYKVIQESAKNQELANEIADRIGITPKMYKQVLSSAQKYRAKYEQRAKETYHYWEIGGEQSIGIGPVRG